MARRSFPCGHSGKGQYCHRCKQEEQAATQKAQARVAEVEERRADKQAWEATFADDAIDLHVLQTRERVTKARDLLHRLAGGEPYTSLGGKRWESDRSVISIPIGWGYRLVLRDDGGGKLRPLACMTHEAYNSLKPGTLG
ncbi:MAG: hypothetical protein JNL82_31470 [Myxococcales bacterium]|nr:hypothetical protein [Myxococcales bacterium]